MKWQQDSSWRLGWNFPLLKKKNKKPVVLLVVIIKVEKSSANCCLGILPL